MDTQTVDTQQEEGTPRLSTAKRPIGYESPTESFIIQQSKTIDVCGHCNKKCAARPYCVISVTLGHMHHVRA